MQFFSKFASDLATEFFIEEFLYISNIRPRDIPSPALQSYKYYANYKNVIKTAFEHDHTQC